ncbi:hypothetical protein BDR26DRAFT_852562 [Obelidium mucronatum]|nr:hypothetical protein BDR26DRAFT_852562 [Obelidium mucronatum]
MFLQPAFPSTSSSLLSPSGGHAPILQQQQQQQLIRPIVTDYSSLNADSLNLLGSTAAERFGGPPIVKWAKQALHALSSLTHCQWVDVMFDTFVSQSTCNEKETIRNSSVKILNAKYKLFDSCSIQDKPKAIEIIEMAREQNRVHVDYMYEYARATVTPLGARLRLSSNDVEKADRLLQLVAIKDKLARQCPDLGERTRLILEMEKVRLQSNENRKLLESIFDGVTTENSCLLHDC